MSHDLERYAQTVITDLGYLFGVFKNDTETVFKLVKENYDWEQKGLLPLAEQYLEVLCRITEDTTWISRKDTNYLIEKTKKELQKNTL